MTSPSRPLQRRSDRTPRTYVETAPGATPAAGGDGAGSKPQARPTAEPAAAKPRPAGDAQR